MHEIAATESQVPKTAAPLEHQRWLPVPAAAAYCDISVASMRKLIAGGKVTAHRLLVGKILIDRDELDALIRASTEKPAGFRARRRADRA